LAVEVKDKEIIRRLLISSNHNGIIKVEGAWDAEVKDLAIREEGVVCEVLERIIILITIIECRRERHPNALCAVPRPSLRDADLRVRSILIQSAFIGGTRGWRLFTLRVASSTHGLI
jgi:hypothetical protein